MSVSRRGFFAMLGGAAGAVIASQVPEIWTPAKTIFLPPAGGWVRDQAISARIDIPFHSSALTMSLEEFTRLVMEPALNKLVRDIEDDVMRHIVERPKLRLVEFG